MLPRKICHAIIAAIALVPAMYFSSVLHADDLSSAYACSPKNPGAESTRRFFRQQDGVSINLSRTDTFPIVCPVTVTDDEILGVLIRLGNTGTSTRRFACALEEYDLDFKLAKTIGKSINITANNTSLINWGPINRLSTSNYLVVRCILPPKGTAGTFVSF